MLRGKQKIQQIRQAQALASNFMIGGVAIPSLEPFDDENMYHFVVHQDFYRIDKEEDDLDRVTYAYPNGNIMEAMFSVRHKWTLGYGVLCRDKRGKVYYVQERYVVSNKEIDFKQIESEFTKQSLTALDKANENYILGLVYCYIPKADHPLYLPHFNAMVYARDVLEKLSTKWEQENCKEINVYRPHNKIEFDMWFTHQNEADFKPNTQIPIEQTTSYNILDNKVKQIGCIHQLHPIPELIPQRYFCDTLYQPINLFEKKMIESVFEVRTKADYEKYVKLMKGYKLKS